jgi:hypothetical protein
VPAGSLIGMTFRLDYPGVVGPDRAAQWFAERATELGLTFLEPIPQQIHVLRGSPNYPGATGQARMIGPTDVELFSDWTIAFVREAVPHDPLPSRERLAQTAGEGRHLFWTVDGKPVSMAGIVRRTRHAAAIASIHRRHCADTAMRGQFVSAAFDIGRKRHSVLPSRRSHLPPSGRLFVHAEPGGPVVPRAPAANSRTPAGRRCR